MTQKTMRFNVSRVAGESSTSHLWRQQDFNSRVKNPRESVSAEKLFADLIRREARQVMAAVTECETVQLPAQLARLDFLRDLIAFARNHDLIADAEKVASSFNPLNAAYTVGDFEVCLISTRKTHRAPAFLNSRDADIAEIKQMISTLAGCFAKSSVIGSILDEANATDAEESEVRL